MSNLLWKKKRKKKENKNNFVVKWKFVSLFEFKDDIRKFFFCFIWNLTKTINRGFYTRFTNIYNYIDSKNFLEYWVFVE